MNFLSRCLIFRFCGKVGIHCHWYFVDFGMGIVIFLNDLTNVFNLREIVNPL
jgi:hypothetical protein